MNNSAFILSSTLVWKQASNVTYTDRLLQLAQLFQGNKEELFAEPAQQNQGEVIFPGLEYVCGFWIVDWILDFV